MEDHGRKRVTIRKTRSGFASREHKAGFVLLAITGMLAIVLGTFYIVRLLNQPFDINYEGPEFVSSEDRRLAEIEKQKVTDTDSDGLVDFDELNSYGTSPYLADTDGDGIDDADELAAGKDPTCPEGTECTGSLYNPTATPDSNAGELFDFVADTSSTSTQNIADLQEAVKQLSAEQVRQLLLDSGADAEAVSQLTDDEIMILYNQVIADMESSGELETLLESSVTEPIE